MRPRWSLVWLAVAALCLIAAAAQYAWMGWRQLELRREWNAGARVAALLPSGSANQTGESAGPMRLLIPRLHLDDAVVPGDGYSDLLIAPGWMPGSALPGDPGNSVIAGHRDTFFRGVAELRNGDMIEVERGTRDFMFQVERRLIVKPDQTWVLASTPEPMLTLVTCYPTYWVGPAPKRLIIQARLLDSRN